MDRQINERMDGKSPHSTGLSPLLGPQKEDSGRRVIRAMIGKTEGRVSSIRTNEKEINGEEDLEDCLQERFPGEKSSVLTSFNCFCSAAHSGMGFANYA